MSKHYSFMRERPVIPAGAVSEFDSYCRKIISYSAALAAAGAVAIYLITYHKNPSLFAGFCLGATFSMLKWRLLIRELKRFAGGGSGRVGHWLRAFLIRYGLTGAIIGVGAASESFSVITTAIGIFLVNIVIIAGQFISVLRVRAKAGETWE